GMLLAGILIGFLRYIPGQTILTDTSLTGLGFFAKIGVILIMFSAGLETDLKKIRSVGKPAIVITCAGVLIPLALGFAVATLFNGGFGNLTHENLVHNLFYGTILTATSVSVSVATLRELGRLDSRVGTTIITAAIIDDVLGIIVLSVVLALKNDAAAGAEAVNPWIVVLRTVVYFIVIAILAFVASKAFRALDKKFPHHRLIPIFSLAFCFLISYVSERFFGIADITGAYIVGLILSTNPDTEYIDQKSDILSYMFFVPIFFGNIGISTNFSGITVETLAFGLVFIAAGIIGKLVGCGTAALCCRYTPSDSFKVGVGMMARAEVALVCAQKGVESGIIDSTIMPFVVLMILLTSFITPILLQKSYKHDEKKGLSLIE
ncbi:MAG TPA: sodium:proton antiporter, partial [Clostridiales bacterium]|nr:sodium:proton antiporter [Clostridiales bacterium]